MPKKLAYVIIRTYSAGVHAGYLINRKGKDVALLNARRLWKWVGAASLSEIALSGVKAPFECKFSVVVPRIELTEAIEVIFCTIAAQKNIEGVPEWKA